MPQPASNLHIRILISPPQLLRLDRTLLNTKALPSHQVGWPLRQSSSFRLRQLLPSKELHPTGTTPLRSSDRLGEPRHLLCLRHPAHRRSQEPPRSIPPPNLECHGVPLLREQPLHLPPRVLLLPTVCNPLQGNRDPHHLRSPAPVSKQHQPTTTMLPLPHRFPFPADTLLSPLRSPHWQVHLVEEPVRPRVASFQARLRPAHGMLLHLRYLVSTPQLRRTARSRHHRRRPPNMPHKRRNNPLKVNTVPPQVLRDPRLLDLVPHLSRHLRQSQQHPPPGRPSIVRYTPALYYDIPYLQPP